MNGMNALQRLTEGWRLERERLAEWEAANPEIAAAWSDAAEEGERRKSERQRRESADWALRDARVPERVRAVLTAGADKTPAVLAVLRWLEGSRSFLLLAGGTGTGKTIAACHALERGGVFERAVSAGRLGLYGDEDVARMRALRRARVLVLDDLGAEFAGDVWRAQFDELVDERYGDRLRTVITTNLSPDAVRERYGARVADRIRHDGQVVTCGAESLRTPGGGAR